ncbi:MAG TPA: MarP family serine protease [Marmoricola sp.]|nr:MarP family serine protease [Marmoricola sp.]
MNVLDWILVVLVVAYAVSGYWQGFITGAFATIGLILGGLLGIWLAPQLLGNIDPSVWVSVGALCIVLLCASFGQALLQYVGSRVRAQVTWQPVRALDAVGGSLLSVAAALMVCWMLGLAISGSRIPTVGPQVRESLVLRQVNAVMPDVARGALNSFNNIVGESFFPRYLEPFAPERIVNVKRAPRTVLRDPDVVAVHTSVFKIRGNNRCGQGVEGTGFLYSPKRVMTNAHVVAGVTEPKVLVDGAVVDATVVYYDPKVDVAVLALTDDVVAPYLSFDTGGSARDVGAVVGYPNDGPYAAVPARVRVEQRLRSPDIYGRGTVTRSVFSLRANVQPGNSGGPLVATNGRVYGVIFAASISDPQTGYALTAQQVAKAATTGIDASQAVSTQGCA